MTYYLTDTEGILAVGAVTMGTVALLVACVRNWVLWKRLRRATQSLLAIPLPLPPNVE